jgi:dienelactone hydrolase
MSIRLGLLAAAAGLVMAGSAQAAESAAKLAPGQNCQFVTWAHAQASAGDANVKHDGSPLPGVTPPDISKGFGGIPRSAQPPLTDSQKRILECSYHLAEANADMPYTLFIPTNYDPKKPAKLIVDLHGLNITPLQQILFDGTTDFAEQYGYMVLAPMGFSVSGGWGARPGNPAPGATTKPGGTAAYGTGELSEIDAMTLLKSIRDKYNIDPNHIFLMGHSMGGGGTYHLGAAHNEIWAGIAPISGAGGIPTDAAAEPFKNLPVLILHGSKDSIVAPATSIRASLSLQDVGAQHVFVEVPGADHEFWIRRGADNMKRVFMFFNILAKDTNPGHITPEMAVMPAPAGGGGRGGAGAGRGVAAPAPAATRTP